MRPSEKADDRLTLALRVRLKRRPSFPYRYPPANT
jgi:hypothetical protein